MNYLVSIDNADGTAETYEVPQAEAYAAVLAEIANPTAGRTSLRIVSLGGAA